jgi:hypothetical protein
MGSAGMHKFLSIFISILVAFQPALADAPRAVKQPSVYQSIIPQLLSVESHEAQHEGELFSANGDVESLTVNQKRDIVFNLFARYSKSNVLAPAYHQFSTEEIRKDLEMFTQTDAHLLRKVCRTQTVFGEAVFAKTLALPTSDKQELLRRQSIVKALIDSPELFTLVEQSLERIKTIEPLLLSFFSPTNELRQQMLDDLYFNRALWSHFDVSTASWDRSPKMLLGTELANKSLLVFSLLFLKWRWEMAQREAGTPFLLSLTAIYTLMFLKPKWFMKVGPFVTPAALTAGGVHMYRSWKKAGSRDGFRLGQELGAATYGASDELRDKIDEHWQPLRKDLEEVQKEQQARFAKMSAGGKFATFVGNGIRSLHDKYTMLELVINTPLQLFHSWRDMKGWHDKYRHLQAKFQKLQQAIMVLHQVNATFCKQRQLLQHMSELYPMTSALETQDTVSADMKKLLGLLKKDTFKGKFTLISHLGNISAANTLMLGARRDWVSVFESIGHLDMYLSIARLMKESVGSRAPYCFATYEDRSTPHIALTDFWNPFVDPEKVVTNSLELGKADRNMILTGPNTGGKSTVLKALAINVLLAQTFGIAAARNFDLVPFSTIITNIRIEDNIEKGVSLFMAETKRAKLLKDTIAALKPDQFGLVIIDEMFRGTAPDQAALLAHHYAKDELGTMQNCMLLEATHYPEMIKLESETNGLFSNYRVAIERNPDGSLHRTYQLQRGSTTQNVAADILREQGFAIKTGA